MQNVTVKNSCLASGSLSREWISSTKLTTMSGPGSSPFGLIIKRLLVNTFHIVLYDVENCTVKVVRVVLFWKPCLQIQKAQTLKTIWIVLCEITSRSLMLTSTRGQALIFSRWDKIKSRSISLFRHNSRIYWWGEKKQQKYIKSYGKKNPTMMPHIANYLPWLLIQGAAAVCADAWAYLGPRPPPKRHILLKSSSSGHLASSGRST